jgi:predicted enzyme related to lactoylglutathione lyase
VVEMTLRFETFPDDLDAVIDFYSHVLRFSITNDQRSESAPYVASKLGSVRGAARRAGPRDLSFLLK